jgi:hypothetical protein
MAYQDIERKKLVETSERHKLELTNELNGIGIKSDKLLTNALIIGGSLAFTYLLVSQLTSEVKKSKKSKAQKAQSADGFEIEEEEEEATLFSQLGAKLVDQATLFLLDIAKEKLSEYIQSKKRENS